MIWETQSTSLIMTKKEIQNRIKEINSEINNLNPKFEKHRIRLEKELKNLKTRLIRETFKPKQFVDTFSENKGKWWLISKSISKGNAYLMEDDLWTSRIKNAKRFSSKKELNNYIKVNGLQNIIIKEIIIK